jgi:protein gp37
VRFLSVEPQLEYLDVSGALAEGVNWVITGGESGPKARPYHAEWALSIVRQCRDAGLPPFVKQMGSNPYYFRTPMKLADRAGAEPSEWPAELRVQEFPEAMS